MARGYWSGGEFRDDPIPFRRSSRIPPEDMECIESIIPAKGLSSKRTKPTEIVSIGGPAVQGGNGIVKLYEEKGG